MEFRIGLIEKQIVELKYYFDGILMNSYLYKYQSGTVDPAPTDFGEVDSDNR